MRLIKKRNIYYLMHKDIPVFEGEYSFHSHSFKSILEIYDYKHLPVSCYTKEGISLERLNTWWLSRAIPGYRVGLNQLVNRLQVTSPHELIEKAHALSVSDNYWLKESKEEVTYDQINFFDHSFNQSGFGMAMFSQVYGNYQSNVLETPNNLTCGYHRKAWFNKNGELCLLKGGTPFYQQEPVQEWLAYQIALYLGFKDATAYAVDLYENNIVSVCPAFTNKDLDLIPAKLVIDSIKVSKNIFHLPVYLNILEAHGIKNAEDNIEHMLLLDYLLMNSDRHNYNFGILVDANTNQWVKCAPIFDTGTGLGCLKSDEEVPATINDKAYRMMNIKNIYYDQLLDLIDLKKYDFTGLEQLPVLFAEQLVKYQFVSNITDNRIESVYELFYKQILKLKKYASTQIY